MKTCAPPRCLAPIENLTVHRMRECISSRAIVGRPYRIAGRTAQDAMAGGERSAQFVHTLRIQARCVGARLGVELDPRDAGDLQRVLLAGLFGREFFSERSDGYG